MTQDITTSRLFFLVRIQHTWVIMVKKGMHSQIYVLYEISSPLCFPSSTAITMGCLCALQSGLCRSTSTTTSTPSNRPTPGSVPSPRPAR